MSLKKSIFSENKLLDHKLFHSVEQVLVRIDYFCNLYSIITSFMAAAALMLNAHINKSLFKSFKNKKSLVCNILVCTWNFSASFNLNCSADIIPNLSCDNFIWFEHFTITSLTTVSRYIYLPMILSCLTSATCIPK